MNPSDILALWSLLSMKVLERFLFSAAIRFRDQNILVLGYNLTLAELSSGSSRTLTRGSATVTEMRMKDESLGYALPWSSLPTSLLSCGLVVVLPL